MLIRVQLESVIDEVLKTGNVQSLHEYLEGDKPESTPINCSQQFLTKLDQFINRVSCNLARLPTFLSHPVLINCTSVCVKEFTPERWHVCKFRSRRPA